ncbi:hypothetical protein CBF34_07885 [Vagococcus penaei]|nr:hypothetical protein CBF34_07885 [Vagococcus penaei]
MKVFWSVIIVLSLAIITRYFKKNYVGFLKWVNRVSSRKISEKKIMETESYKQNSLAPKLLEGDDLKKIQPYIDRLDESVRMPDVHNVALMSSYGAGKSTILRNFENAHDENNYLNLSLGSYSKKDHEEFVDERGNKITVDLSEKLENSLVKQMIYREKKAKLPHSRFKKINNISKGKIVFFLLTEFLSILSFLFLNDFLNLQTMLKNRFEFIQKNIEMVNFIFYFLFLLGLFVLLAILINIILKQFSLSKLSVGNITIEGNEGSTSYFNKYIDEIIYYFETNNFNVVVIEDVDRFGSIKVFEHLKELNILLNNAKQINRNITFIYALKEDIFSKIEDEVEEHESELRTKFFELIIPVIPVLDGFNSRDYLIPLIESKEKERKIKVLKEKDSIKIEKSELAANYPNDIILEKEFELFLSDISLHIHDLRLLNNIVNEYYTFIDVHGKLSDSFDKKRLFSLITLKNLIPSVYTKLQKSEGALYKAIATDEYDNELISHLKQELQDLEAELEDIQFDLMVNKIGTAKLFFFEKGLSGEDELYIDEDWKLLSNITLEELEMLFEAEDNELRVKTYEKGAFNVDITKLLIDIKEPSSLLKKKRDKKINEVNQLKDKITAFQRLSLQEKLRLYPNLANSIFDLPTEYSNDTKSQENILIKIPSYHKLKVTIREKAFILFLITNGYLAEDYSSYLSIFYEGKSLTANDKNVLVKIKSNQRIEFNEDLSDSSVVIENLSIKDFESPGILNKNMLLYLFSDKYKDKENVRDVVLKNWFNQDENIYLEQLDILLNEEKISKVIFKMIEIFGVDFFRKSKESMKSKLVNLIISSTILEESYFGYRDGVPFNTILNEPYFNEEPEPEPEYLLRENIISRPHFFSEMENFIEKSKLIESLASFNNNDETYDDAKILFEDIDMGDLSGQEFKLFIELELFDFNTKIFESILNYGENEMVKEVSYENILQMENQDLITNIQDNLDEFIRDVLLELEVLHETEESFIEMLNLYDEEDAEYIRYGELISRANTKIFDISRIKNQKLWNKIFEFEKYKLNWLNLMTFKTSEKVDLEYLRIIFNDSSIIPYLKSDYEQFSDKTKSDTENLLKGLVDKKIIDVNENNLEILKLSKYEAYHLDATSVKFLISNDLVVFDIETLDEFRDFDLKDKLLLNFQDDYVENANEIMLTINEIIGLIKGWNTSDLLRLINLLFTKEFPELFVDQKFIDTLLSEQIIITDEQMNKLINLNSSIDSIQEYFIFNINKGMLDQETIETVLTTIYETSINTLTSDDFEVIFSQSFDSELFVKYMNFVFRKFKYTDEQYEIVETWLKKQEIPYNQLYIDGRMREIVLENNSMIRELLDNLIDVGIVSSYKEKEPEKLSVYVKRNKPESKVEVKLL